MKTQVCGVSRSRRFDARRGTATVELAICLPVLAGLIFGSIEACGMIYATQSLEIAAYESVRMAVRATAYQRQPGQPNVMTNAQVEAHAEEVLLERGITDAVVTITPADLTEMQSGEVVSVTITAPALSNTIVLPAWFWGGVELMAQASMVKEVNS